MKTDVLYKIVSVEDGIIEGSKPNDKGEVRKFSYRRIIARKVMPNANALMPAQQKAVFDTTIFDELKPGVLIYISEDTAE